MDEVAVQRMAGNRLFGRSCRIERMCAPRRSTIRSERETWGAKVSSSCGGLKTAMGSKCEVALLQACRSFRPIADIGNAIRGPSWVRSSGCPILKVRTVASSCGGMAGPFGYQAETYEVSMAMGELANDPSPGSAFRPRHALPLGCEIHTFASTRPSSAWLMGHEKRKSSS
jgi:hypothetical protein